MKAELQIGLFRPAAALFQKKLRAEAVNRDIEITDWNERGFINRTIMVTLEHHGEDETVFQQLLDRVLREMREVDPNLVGESNLVVLT